jgi:hypothetical protein
MAFEVPRQQERYRDTGRREITLLGRTVLASRVRLKESDAIALGADYEIYVDRLPGISNQQIQGQVIRFEGDACRVVRVTDPKAGDPTMRGRYLKLLTVSVPDT